MLYGKLQQQNVRERRTNVAFINHIIFKHFEMIKSAVELVCISLTDQTKFPCLIFLKS